MQDEERELYNKALNLWGFESQIKICVEECSELNVALMKFGRKINGSSIEQILDELADATNSINQMLILFDISHKRFEEIRLEKLRKLSKIIERCE